MCRGSPPLLLSATLQDYARSASSQEAGSVLGPQFKRSSILMRATLGVRQSTGLGKLPREGIAISLPVNYLLVSEVLAFAPSFLLFFSPIFYVKLSHS